MTEGTTKERDIPLKTDAKVAAKTEAITTPEGFTINGKNETSLIRSLLSLNGTAISTLEERMRPNKYSTIGFLSEDESLIDVLSTDNDTVIEMGLTHRQLADFLSFKGVDEEDRKAITNGTMPYEYNGRKFNVKAAYTPGGSQISPFEDGTYGDSVYWLTNVETAETIHYSGLVREMIHRYGFYEGKGTSYRVDPRAIAQIAGLIQKLPEGAKQASKRQFDLAA